MIISFYSAQGNRTLYAFLSVNMTVLFEIRHEKPHTTESHSNS